jgi:hypothetical protein
VPPGRRQKAQDCLKHCAFRRVYTATLAFGILFYLARTLMSAPWACNQRATTGAQPSPRVCTYFEEIFDSESGDDYRQMLDFWRTSWQNQGWITTVLTSADAAKHPKFGAYQAIFAEIPSVNPPKYELACFMRWVAAVQAGCGWLSDMDVINYGFPPQYPFSGPVLYSFHGQVPSLVTGDQMAFEAVIDAFVSVYRDIKRNVTNSAIQTINGRPHTSDMYIIASRPDLYFNIGFPSSLKRHLDRHLSVLLHYSKREVREVLGNSEKSKSVHAVRPLPPPRVPAQ